MCTFPAITFSGTWTLLFLSALTTGGAEARAQQCPVEWVSTNLNGGVANGSSGRPAISADGLAVAFASDADNLILNDGNSVYDVFLRDRATGATILISRPTTGGQANDWSSMPSISSDGRFVAFRSVATNLDPADSDPKPDIYRHDRQTGETVLVSHRLIAGTHPEGVYLISDLSDDGRFVAFECFDDNLVPGDQNGFIDVYVRDMLSGTTELVSVGNQGELGNDGSDSPSMSADGRYIAFASGTSNWLGGNPQHLPHIYVRDRVLGKTSLVSYAPSGTYGPVGGGWTPSMSGDGTKVAFVYLGADILPSLFGHAWGGSQVFVRDLVGGGLTYVGYSIGGGLSDSECRYPSLSHDGRYVAWESLSNDLTVTPGHTNENIFHRDLETGVTTLASRGMGGAKPNGYSVQPCISADGRTVGFASQASNLVPGDTGLGVDIFVRECDVASPTVYCSAKGGASGCVPMAGFTGSPSASSGTGFLVCADSLLAEQPALVLYSARPAFSRALGMGILCLQPPFKRTPPLWSGGTPGTCNGAIDFDMNAWIASGLDPALAAGETAYAQVWARDPLESSGGILSEAVAFLIEP